jgi:hypothetical protein
MRQTLEPIGAAPLHAHPDQHVSALAPRYYRLLASKLAEDSSRHLLFSQFHRLHLISVPQSGTSSLSPCDDDVDLGDVKSVIAN